VQTNNNITKTVKRLSRFIFDIPRSKRIEDERLKNPKHKKKFIQQQEEE
jgi:hypothetical protein